jgi:hypothetical protein
VEYLPKVKMVPEKETKLPLCPRINQFGIDNTWVCGKISSPPVDCSNSFSRGFGNSTKPKADFCREYAGTTQIGDSAWGRHGLSLASRVPEGGYPHAASKNVAGKANA